MKNIKQHIKPILLILLFFLLSLVVLNQVYKVVTVSDTEVISKSEDYRAEIETTPKKWLNGYLGVVFRFKSMGNLNWLIIPLVLWFLWSQRQRGLSPAVKALFIVWLLSFLFICLTGYANSRYQLTLFPFTVFIILYIIWQVLQGQPWPIKTLVFLLLCGLCVHNIIYFSQHYRFFWELKVSRAASHFPQKMVNYLNQEKKIGTEQSRVYVFNQPFYYYYTAKRGIDYVSPIYTEIFIELTRKEADRQAMYDMIFTKNRVAYLLVGSSILSQYRDRMLTEFLNCECYPIFSEYGYRLFAIRSSSLEKILQKKHMQALPQVNVLNAEIHGLRGTFAFNKNPGKNELHVENLTASKKGERLIQFGFDSLNPQSGIPVAPGKYIYFIVEGRISKGLMNRTNYIFIRDFQEKWQNTTTYFVSHLQRTYFLMRPIRSKSTRVMMGIRFTPRGAEDYLIITRIRAYISNYPLE